MPLVDDIVRSIATDVGALSARKAPQGITEDGWRKVLRGAYLGIHPSRLWGLSGVGKREFASIMEAEAWRHEAMEAEGVKGESEIAEAILDGAKGWESKAWVLERTRDGWRKEQRQGAPLAVAVQVLGRFDDCESLPNAQTVEPKRLAE